MQENLERFFSNIGFDSKSDFTVKDGLSIELEQFSILQYAIGDVLLIYFLYLPEKDFSNSLLKTHQIIWNDNKTEVFIVISDYHTHLCASKYKPDQKYPGKCLIESFDYGVNSPEFTPDKIQQLVKENIDYGFFWDFVRQKLQKKKRRGVDRDLLLNLIFLKEELQKFVIEEKTYILIERCLFLKFLEDRHFLKPQTLLEILKEQDSTLLLRKFAEINSLLNGDIFYERDLSFQDFVEPKLALSRLYLFFTTDYRNQIRLFPYKFNILPIELLSNIYEAFLKIEDKVSGGIYYTPTILADLLLDETLSPLLRTIPYPTCLDFSCGSGIFLVKAYERLINHYKCQSNFEAKKELLKTSIFGIEKDQIAARITVFSLYLKLLEGEDPACIRSLIQVNRIKFPKLLNNNIQCKNTLFDTVVFKNEDGKLFAAFDVVVGNPPWGVNPFKDSSLTEDSEMQLSKDKQEAVTLFQSSQYFTLKAKDFMSTNAIAGILTNNSNLLTSKSTQFRQKLLQEYSVEKIYDFRLCNSILFEKHKLRINRGSIQPTETIELGADEPAVALILKPNNKQTPTVEYIVPSIDRLTKLLKIVWVKPSDASIISKELLEKDLTWRIFAANGDIEDYELIQKLIQHKGNAILEGFYGIRFKKSGEPILKDVDYLDKDCIEHFIVKKTKRITQAGKSIKRPGKCFPKQILIHRYVKKDLRIKAAYDPDGIRFQDNLIGLHTEKYDHRLLLALFNSSLISYFLFYNSAQIGKGTFNMLHENELETIPIPSSESISPEIMSQLVSTIEKIQNLGTNSHELLSKVDELVFNIFHLKDIEKQTVRDFFSIADRQNDSNSFVTNADFLCYARRFRDVFSFLLKDDKFLNADIFCSRTIGAGITLTIVDISDKNDIIINNESNLAKIVSHVAKRQLQQSDMLSIIKQEKFKIYNTDSLTILKSNYYKDWTETQAIKDAKEEIELFVQNLPEK